MGKNDMICTLHYYSEGLTQKFDKDKFSRGTTLSYNITEFNGHHFYRAFLTLTNIYHDYYAYDQLGIMTTE